MGRATEVVRHSLARTASVVVVLAIFGAAGYGGYRIVKQSMLKPSTTQNADSITNNYTNPKPGEIQDVITEGMKKQKKKFFIGLVLWGVEVGVGK